MKKSGTAKMQGIHYPYGSVTEMENKETQEYILPESVKLTYHGEPLTPTQFDAHGNPQIGGLANLILIWKTRQLMRDGVIESQYDMQVEYSYETTDVAITIPAEKRLPRHDICPVCGRPITLSDLEGWDEIVEDYGNGLTASHDESRIEELEPYGVVAHAKCAKGFYRLKMIDQITETVGLAFRSYDIDEEHRVSWGKGAGQMWYELIPNEYCSRACCAHRPWFLFHTPIGDIKVGWRKRVINITFMDNFAQFDFNGVFAEENVTKNVEGKCRTIHAWGKDKLFNYLVAAQQDVYKKAEPASSK